MGYNLACHLMSSFVKCVHRIFLSIYIEFDANSIQVLIGRCSFCFSKIAEYISHIENRLYIQRYRHPFAIKGSAV